MNRSLIVVLSFLSGFISLSQEIAWVRIVSLALQSTPQSFSFVLLCFILGIALGSVIGARRATEGGNPAQVLAVLFGFSGLVAIASPLVLQAVGVRVNLGILGILILIPSMLKGAVFPLVHHYFSQLGPRLGRTLSFVYAANIAGCTLGPALTGFIVLDLLPVFTVLFVLGALELIIAAVVFPSLARSLRAVAIGLALCAVVFTAPLGHGLMREFLGAFHPEGEIVRVVENRHGVIHTMRVAGKQKDLIYGGNVYDGAFNVDLRDPINRLNRVYLLGGLKPEARRVLVIGLSSGSWTQVLRTFPDLETMDVVEINSGYLQLIGQYPGAADLLGDDRVRIHIDDGRRWLSRAVQAGARYDLIVMNTTWHWRSNASSLLSAEFLSVVRSGLAQGGLMAFNTTGSYDSFYTAATVFPSTFRYRNFVYGTNHPLLIDEHQLHLNLCRMKVADIGVDGCDNPAFAAAVAAIVPKEFITWEQQMKLAPPALPPELITDDNMLTEYRRGKSNPSVYGY